MATDTAIIAEFESVKATRIERERCNWQDWASQETFSRFIAVLESATIRVSDAMVIVTVDGGTVWTYVAGDLLDTVCANTGHATDGEIFSDTTSAWITSPVTMECGCSDSITCAGHSAELTTLFESLSSL